jgi:hypothetical protein
MDKHLCNKFPLEKGLYYTKAGVGVKKPDFHKSHVEVNGEQYLFISIKNGKYLNELHSDGLDAINAGIRDMAA